MSKISLVTVKFQGNKSVKFQNTTVLEIAKKLLNNITFSNLQPMLIVFCTGKKLYFEKSYWLSFFNKDISVVELFENCETDGLFRNTNTINFENKIDIDPGALWSKKGTKLYLINDDWNIVVKFNTKLFTEI